MRCKFESEFLGAFWRRIMIEIPPLNNGNKNAMQTRQEPCDRDPGSEGRSRDAELISDSCAQRSGLLRAVHLRHSAQIPIPIAIAIQIQIHRALDLMRRDSSRSPDESIGRAAASSGRAVALERSVRSISSRAR